MAEQVGHDEGRPGVRWSELDKASQTYAISDWITGDWIDLPHFCAHYGYDLRTFRSNFSKHGLLQYRRHHLAEKSAREAEWQERQLRSAHGIGVRLDDTVNLALQKLQLQLLQGAFAPDMLLKVIEKLSGSRRRAYDPLQLEVATTFGSEGDSGSIEDKAQMLPPHIRHAIASKLAKYGAASVRKAEGKKK